jgi:hypothetical protein
MPLLEAGFYASLFTLLCCASLLSISGTVICLMEAYKKIKRMIRDPWF